MTPEETREAAAVMNAWADGKKIEYRLKGAFLWRGVPDPVWDFECNDYRVAPEPWTGKIWVHPDGRVVSENNADNRQAWAMNGWRLITAKEVTDD